MDHDTLTFYADESGNAGINYLDSEQPHHVSAGWLVEPERSNQFVDVLAKFFGPSSAEVKGGDLVKRPRGQQRLVTLLKDLRSCAEPFFVVYERDFSIAGRVQSVFFDAFHNRRAHWIVPGDAVHEQRVSELLSEILPRTTLAAFAAVYRHPSASNMLPVAVEIEQHLRTSGETLLADTMLGAVESIEQIAHHENYAAPQEGLSHAASASLNVPAVVQLVRKVDTYMDALAPRRFDVVHDDTQVFGAAIKRSLTALGCTGQARDAVMSEGVRRRMLLGNLGDVRLVESRADLGVRAADILAAVVRHQARILSHGKVPSGDLRKLCRLTLSELEGEDPPKAGIYMNRKTLQKIWAPAIRSAYRR